MGQCKYCGEDAGFFSHVHKECEEKHCQGLTILEDEVAEVPLGKLGFYTEDLDEFEARVAEIEADLDEVENGNEDPQKWVTSEQFNQELYQEFPWLR